ncbi:MAG: hypothetical protein HY821_00855 [Acidobacteria bacterium]|nr:hypothetical protein [Acidobacteriota bacterium]
MKKPAKHSEGKTGSPGGEMTSKAHTDLFARAMKLFSAGKYREALPYFENAAAGPLMSVNESAAMYRRMCEKRTQAAEVKLQTAEEYYTYGVSLLNARKWQEAKGPLETAVAKGGEPHYLYALALAEGMTGGVAAAAQYLRRAVAADGAIRGVARSDADFAPLLDHAQIREVLTGEPVSG